ncbi:MAG: DUF2500 domain-containing protein [Erysipelotrichaceae bacterium]
MEYVNVLLIVLFISVLAYAIFKGPGKMLSDVRAKEVTLSATLSDKRIQENESMRFGFGVQTEHERYYLTFNGDDGSSLEFRVAKNDFYDFEIGTHGKVTFQGALYKGFESDETPSP